MSSADVPKKPTGSSTVNIWTKIGVLSGVISTLVAVVNAAFVILINRDTNQIKDQLGLAQTMITSPRDGDEVDTNDVVVGRTGIFDKNIYLVVTADHRRYVQGGPLGINADGSWKQVAQFGEAGTCSTTFEIGLAILPSSSSLVTLESSKLISTVIVKSKKCVNGERK